MERSKEKLNKRGVIYARYSEGPRQTDQSIEGQVADCRAYADVHNINIIGLYADRHISGTSTEGRDEFLRMMHDADRHAFDCIVTWKIDRFGRSREDIAVNKIRLKKAGVQLHYAKESVPEGPEGILLESLLEGLAEYYSADLRQKVVRGIRESAKKGKISAGQIPIGYKRNPDDGRLVIDPPAADAVREVFRMHLAGAGIADMQMALYKRGIRSRQGKEPSQSVIYRMLRNEHYLGRFEVQGVEILVDPVIDRATFEQAATRFKGSRHNAAGRADVDYLLSCKCHCANCGKLLQGSHGTGKLGKKYYYYRCPSKDMRAIQKEELEDLVIQSTCQQILTDEMIEKLTAKIMKIQELDAAADQAKALKSELKDLKKRQANLVRALENGASTALVARLAEIETQIDDKTLEIEKASLKNPVIPEEVVHGWLQSFRSGDKDDPLFRKRLVQTFVSDVIVSQDEVVITYNTNEKEPTRCSCTTLKVDLARSYANPEVIGSLIVLRIPRK